jgi:hypothetical protein
MNGDDAHNDGRWLTRVLRLRHTTAFLAIGALVLYGVGLVRTIGLLHAEGIETTRGVPLAPLQDYLVRGISVMATPATLATMVMIGGIVVLALVLPEWLRSRVSRQRARHRETTPQEFGGILFTATVATTGPFLLFFPLAETAPTVGPLAFVVSGFAWALYTGRFPHNWVGWTRAHSRAVAAGFLLTFLASALLLAYFAPPPIDEVTIRTSAGGHVTGSLVALTGSAIYVVPQTEEDGTVTVIPLARVTSLVIADGPRRTFRTLPEIMGLHIGRLELPG